MKTAAWVVVFLMVLVSSSAFGGDVPKTIVVRGYLTDLSGAPLTKVAPMSYGIYKTLDGPETDKVLEEDLGNVNVSGGVYFVEIGKQGGLDAAFLGSAELYLEVRVEGTKMMPRQKIGSVPFSFVALDAVGDIHPKSVTVGTTPVIDTTGKWVGDRSDIGTVKSIGTTAPLSGGPITDTGTISLAKSDGTTSGYLSSTDWAVFNGKQSRVTGVCNAGMSAVSVNLDGSLNCEPSYGGTVTNVGTGAGLTGGPVTTTGTILLDAPYLDGSAYDARFVNEGQANSVTSAMIVDGTIAFSDIGQNTCNANQVIKRNTGNTAWTCSDEANAGGTITNIATGTGLTGGPITQTGTVSLAASYADGSFYDSRFVNTDGDTMIGGLGLPADGLTVGTDQLVCSGGNVGIGTADPQRQLHIYQSNSNYFEMLRVQGASATGKPHITVGGPDGDHGIVLGHCNSSSVGFLSYAGNTPCEAGTGLMMTTDGKIGIGTTSPDSKLHVAGDAHVAGRALVDGNMIGGKFLTQDGSSSGSASRTETLFTPPTESVHLFFINGNNPTTYKGMDVVYRAGDASAPTIVHLAGSNYSLSATGVAVQITLSGGDGTIYWSALRVR